MIKKLRGTTERPRLAINRSNQYIYAQVIDDEKGITIVGVTEKQLEKRGKKMENAKALGLLIAAKAMEKKVTKVVFDRGSKNYHGLVKSLAEGAREGGLQF